MGESNPLEITLELQKRELVEELIKAIDFNLPRSGQRELVNRLLGRMKDPPKLVDHYGELREQKGKLNALDNVNLSCDNGDRWEETRIDNGYEPIDNSIEPRENNGEIKQLQGDLEKLKSELSHAIGKSNWGAATHFSEKVNLKIQQIMEAQK